MPIKNRHLYPANWEEIATLVKNNANWTCQQCGKRCVAPKEKWENFRKNLPEGAKRNQFTLTTAHYPDSNPGNCNLDNLLALCAPCHLRLDVNLHVANRRKNTLSLLEAQGQLKLF